MQCQSPPSLFLNPVHLLSFPQTPLYPIFSFIFTFCDPLRIGGILGMLVVKWLKNIPHHPYEGGPLLLLYQSLNTLQKTETWSLKNLVYKISILISTFNVRALNSINPLPGLVSSFIEMTGTMVFSFWCQTQILLCWERLDLHLSLFLGKYHSCYH